MNLDAGVRRHDNFPEDEEISTIPKREIKREAMTSVPSVQVFEYAQLVKTAHYVYQLASIDEF